MCIRDSGHMLQLASIDGTEIVAISDLHEELVDRSVSSCIKIAEGRHQNIARYFGDENKWEKMLREVKPDMVIIATNWNNHAKMAVESMKNGAHTLFRNYKVLSQMTGKMFSCSMPLHCRVFNTFIKPKSNHL